MLISLWKPSIGLLIPMVILWGYSFFNGFKVFSLPLLIGISVIHFLCQVVGWWFSSRNRDAVLAFSGAGVTGLSLGFLAAMFFGPLLGLFMWVGLVGKVAAYPVSIGVKPILKTFSGGAVRLCYGISMSGILSYLLFS